MYGLLQTGRLVNELLEKRLNKHGYHQSKIIPGLWKHNTQPISFTLVVGNSRVKYVKEEHAKHLMSVLQESYAITHKWKGERKKTSPPVHARLRRKGTIAIQSPLPNKTTGFALPTHPCQIRSQHIVYKDTGWRPIGYRTLAKIRTPPKIDQSGNDIIWKSVKCCLRNVETACHDFQLPSCKRRRKSNFHHFYRVKSFRWVASAWRQKRLGGEFKSHTIT